MKRKPKKKKPNKVVRKKKKKLTLKKKIRYEALSKWKAIRVRKELIDFDDDWLKKLKRDDPKAFDYYAQFNDEYVHNNVKKTKNKKKVKEGHLHNTLALAKSVSDANNHRNNDVFGVNKANNLISEFTHRNDIDGSYIKNHSLYEDELNDKIDKSEEATNEDMVLSFNEFKTLKNSMTDETRLFYETYYKKELLTEKRFKKS